jgi:hypothetical protein
MSDVIEIRGRNPLLGTWKSCAGFSDLQFTVSAEGGKLAVTGIDTADGERAEIRDVVWQPEPNRLQFSAYWASTGRLTKYSVMPAPKSGRAMVTYTHTDHDTWEQI